MHYYQQKNHQKITIEMLNEQLFQRQTKIDCTGINRSGQAFLTYKLYQKQAGSIIIILPSVEHAEKFTDDLAFFSQTESVPTKSAQIVYFPPYNILPFKYLAYHNETAAKRIKALYQLSESSAPLIVVTTVEAVLQKIIPKAEILNFAELLMRGEEIDRDKLIEKLVIGGYIRTMLVEEPGDFCVRGGIIDIFSPLYDEPLRIELYGDMVDSLRFFSPTGQRTLSTVDEAVILPAREIILPKENLKTVIARIREQAAAVELSSSAVREIVDRIKNEGIFPGLESLSPLIFSKLATFFDYIPDKALIILSEPADLEKSAAAARERILKNYHQARDEQRICVEPGQLYLDWDEASALISEKRPLSFKILPVLSRTAMPESQSVVCEMHTSDNSDLREQLKNSRKEENLFLPLADWVTGNQAIGITSFFVFRSESQAHRLESILRAYGIELILYNIADKVKTSASQAFICFGELSGGFVWAQESIAYITESEIFGKKYHFKKKTTQKARTDLLVFEDLKQGDLVVHTRQGIGRYEGLIKLVVDRSQNDFLLIIYKDEDKLYLPVDRMSLIQKYMGVDGYKPILDKMGGKSWARIKEKIKKSTEKMAGELLKLYAGRKVKKGDSYNIAGSEMAEFVDNFPYEETVDQSKAIEDVLEDMRKPVPMDRLICGDVGYGKTEVALRASFMAVNNNKQVAILVPTTVLAEQHFATFKARCEKYPLKIECLSRFRSRKNQNRIIKELKDGTIDIIIGTHRLIQKDVSFKSLGLFILDEEQRFGVTHKEKLKKIRNSVDVLALTATPIPRTLHLSLMGIRDISIISTPPEHRHSIITYVSEFDDAVIIEAVRNELRRGGQIFFVHNNIHSIYKMADHLKKLTPEIKLGVAHGRLSENELEKVMFSFFKNELDMLVCTTIIESGLDVSSANTIIVNRADRFGLSQIYQLRGRVGRSDTQAFAYLFIPKESSLSINARKRLKVLMEHSDLGSGFQIAMSDLKIRGGGAILGASQSGHIAAVGYDMFLKLMEDSISELKGQPVVEDLEPEINLAMSTFIAESYIPDIDQRLSIYRRLAKMTELQEISGLKAELLDRFGKLPEETANLLLKIMLKVMSIKAGVKRLDLYGKGLALHFSEAHQKKPFGIVDLLASSKNQYEFTRDHILKAQLKQASTTGLLSQTKLILSNIAQYVNPAEK